MSRTFSTGRNEVRDQIDRFSDPNYGRDAFMDMVGNAAPTVDSFLARQAANGGSAQMAREQAQEARQQTFAQGLGALNQMQRGAQQTAASLSQGLMQDDTTRRNFDKKLAFQKRQANKGGGLGGLLGEIAGTGLGIFTGGAASGLATNLFDGNAGGGGGQTNPYGSPMDFGIDSYF